jgi:hypothetical protein
MNWIENRIRSLFNYGKERKRERRKRKAEIRAEFLYQICEYDKNIWLTYDSHLIMPMSIITDCTDSAGCVGFLNAIRDLYVQREIKTGMTIKDNCL